MPSVKIYNVKGETVGQEELSAEYFGVKPSSTLIHQIVVAQEANRRTTKAHTKTRGDIAGGGKKPWKQKGTGRARQGSIRSPQWVGGGIVFGPNKERNYTVKINRKAKKKALFMILSDRVLHDKLVVVDQFPVDNPKTKQFVEWSKNLPLGRKSLVVIPSSNPELLRMVKNLKNIKLVTVNALQVAEIVKYPTIVFEQPGLKAFETLYCK